ncbi:MAG: L28 family ribosomal protein, partial [Clostridia bacterium]|nr:L28 family ribosomal protein [Clostridia bacterium]
MSNKCDICDKGKVTGMKVSHSHRRSKKTWAP